MIVNLHPYSAARATLMQMGAQSLLVVKQWDTLEKDLVRRCRLNTSG